MKTFKNLTQFKAHLKPGVKLGCLFHKQITGQRGEAGNPIYVTKDMGIRPVSKVKTNSFSLRTQSSIRGEFDSWCYFPKAKECSIFADRITILEEERGGTMMPVLTYWIVE